MQYKVLTNVESLNFKLKNNLNSYLAETQTLFLEIKKLFHSDFESFTQKFGNSIQDINLYNPSNALKRGYAIVKNPKTNQVVEKWSAFTGDKIVVTLQDGDQSFEPK
jgi:exonuclease VII large subunit